MRNASTGFGEVTSFSDDLNATRFVVEQALNEIVTATLVLVKGVGDGTVNVQPLVSQVDGAGNSYPHSIIQGMPYVTLCGGTNAVVMQPVVGDIGLAVFAHSDTSAARANRKPSPPGSGRRFDWADGVYLGGLIGAPPAQFVRLDPDTGIEIQALAGKSIKLSSSDKIAISGPADTDTEYRVDGVKVVGAQQGAITPPTGGTMVDSQARTAISSIIAALHAHGLIA